MPGLFLLLVFLFSVFFASIKLGGDDRSTKRAEEN